MPTLEWRLRAQITESGYATIAEFAHVLQQHIDISRAHVYRLADHEPELLSLDVLCGLCTALPSYPGQLIVYHREPARCTSATRRVPPRLVLP